MNNQNNPLLEYVQKQMQHGSDPARVRQALLGAGWDAASVDGALRHFAPKAAHPAAPQHHGAQPHKPHHPTAQHPHTQPAQHQAASQVAHQPHTQQAHAASGVASTSTAVKHHKKASAQDAPEDYRVFGAIAETFKAFKASPKTISLGTLVSYVISFVAFGILAALALALLGGFSDPGELTVGSVVALVVACLLAIAVAIPVQSITTSVLSYCFDDAADKHREPFGKTFKSAMKRVVRVSLATVLSALLIAGPFFIVITSASLLAMPSLLEPTDATSANSDIAGLGASILLSLAAGVWAIIAALRYALVPYVALYEPKVKLTKTLGRSRQLLQQGGQWFVFKGALLSMVVGLIIVLPVDILTGDSESLNQIISNILLIPLEVVIIGVMTMLYRNRQAVRD